ncbi:unnamed protein product [Oikopleura dioica]|uniref:Uncharacterized protein n=1 Tax=Oikopleura dioica TaxID=34765 RepID=E4YPU4_OIKDI|nr:unnamed protein product [Oikopleura dioica]
MICQILTHFYKKINLMSKVILPLPPPNKPLALLNASKKSPSVTLRDKREETSFSVETQREDNKTTTSENPPKRRVSRAASWKKPRKQAAVIDYNPSARWLLQDSPQAHATSTLQSAQTKSQTRTMSNLTRKLSVESKLTNDTVYTDRPTFGRKMNQRLNM